MVILVEKEWRMSAWLGQLVTAQAHHPGVAPCVLQASTWVPQAHLCHVTTAQLAVPRILRGQTAHCVDPVHLRMLAALSRVNRVHQENSSLLPVHPHARIVQMERVLLMLDRGCVCEE